MMDFLHEINVILWVIGNALGFLVFFSATAFAILYPLLFKLGQTTGGVKIWWAVLSVMGFGFLTFLGIFVDGRVPAWEMPPDVSWWRPIVRLAVYAVIAYSFGGLVIYLLMRRFDPERLKIAPKMAAVLSARIESLGDMPRDSADKVAEELVNEGWAKRGTGFDPDTVPPPRRR